jgi:hypothetical protein
MHACAATSNGNGGELARLANEQVWNRCTRDDIGVAAARSRWTPRTMHPLRNYLRRELSRPAVDLALGVGFGDIRDHRDARAPRLANQQCAAATVVGYSMAVVAAYLLKCLDQVARSGNCDHDRHTHRGVPCLAEWWSLLARWCRSTTRCARPAISSSTSNACPHPDGTTFLSIAGATDTVVPPDCANVEGEGCQNLVIPGLDHWTLPTCAPDLPLREGGARPAKPALRVADLAPQALPLARAVR